MNSDPCTLCDGREVINVAGKLQNCPCRKHVRARKLVDHYAILQGITATRGLLVPAGEGRSAPRAGNLILKADRQVMLGALAGWLYAHGLAGSYPSVWLTDEDEVRAELFGGRDKGASTIGNAVDHDLVVVSLGRTKNKATAQALLELCSVCRRRPRHALWLHLRPGRELGGHPAFDDDDRAALGDHLEDGNFQEVSL